MRIEWKSREELEKFFPSKPGDLITAALAPKPGSPVWLNKDHQRTKEGTMRKFIAYHIVEAGKVLGASIDNQYNEGDYVINVDLGDERHETVRVSKTTLDYEMPSAGDYLLRGIKGQIQIMPADEFEEAHAELFPQASSAKSFVVNTEE